MVKLTGECAHRTMPKVPTKRGGAVDPMDNCWHQECEIIRIFANGRLLLQNPKGYVRAANLLAVFNPV